MFVRSTTHLRLTKAGEQFLPNAQHALAALQRGFIDIKRGAHKQELRVLTTHYLAACVLPRVISRFRQEEPETTVTIQVWHSSDVAEQVLSGSADLGFLGLNVSAAHLCSVPVLHDEIVLVGPADAPVALAIRQLEDYPLISFSRRPSYWDLVAPVLAASDVVPRERLCIDDVTAIKEMVRRGLGLSFIPRVALRIDAQGLRTIRLTDAPRIQRTSFVLYRKRRHALRERFLHVMKDALNEKVDDAEKTHM